QRCVRRAEGPGDRPRAPEGADRALAPPECAVREESRWRGSAGGLAGSSAVHRFGEASHAEASGRQDIPIIPRSCADKAGGPILTRMALAQAATPSVAPLLDALDPEQRAAATLPDGPAQIIAPAGSGKTTTLIARLGVLLTRGVPAERIAVVTFNREAAQELSARIATR